MNVVDLASPVSLMLHDYLHRYRFHSWVRLQAADLGLGSVRMREHKSAGDPLDCLERESALLLKFPTALFSPLHKLGVSGFRLGKASFGSCDLFLYFCRGPTDIIIGFLYQLGKR